MKRILAPFIAAAILSAPNAGAWEAWASVVRTAPVRVSAGSLTGAAGAGLSTGSQGRGSVSGGALAPRLGVSGLVPLQELSPVQAEGAPVSGAAPAVPAAAVKPGGSAAVRSLGTLAKSQAEKRLPGLKRALSSMAKTFQVPKAEKSSALTLKDGQDALWDQAGKRDPSSLVPAGASLGSKPSGLKRGRALGRKSFYGAVPVAALPAALGAGKVAAGWGWLTALFTGLPGAVQTSLAVSLAFGLAWLAPKVVRPAAKFFFKHVEWNRLREDWMSSVISYAAWGGAFTYTIGMLGGLEALAINGSVFALATAFAVKDVANNLAAGLFLYQNRTLEEGDQFEGDGEKGLLESATPRFMLVDTSGDPEADFEKVLIPNERLIDKGIGGSKKDAAETLLGAAFLPMAVSKWAALGPWGQGAIILGAALLIGKLLSRLYRDWDGKAKDAKGRDAETFRRMAKRAKIVWWVRTVVYGAGLVTILNLAGVPVSGLAGAMSILSAAAGFYMKAVSQNLVGGLMVAAYLPFKTGDYIKVGKYEGVVAGMTQSELRLLRGEPKADGTQDYWDIPMTLLMKEKIYIGKKTLAAK